MCSRRTDVAEAQKILSPIEIAVGGDPLRMTAAPASLK